MSRKVMFGCVAVLLALSTLARAEELKPAPLPKDNRAKEVYQKVVRSTALILVRTKDGIAQGTGWVVDAQKRQVMTNHHVVEGGREILVVFPQ